MGLEIILAIIGVVSGGGLATLIATMSNGGKSYRKELRQDLIKHQTQIDKLTAKMQAFEDEADAWKAKYFDLVFAVKAYKLKVAGIAAAHDIPAEIIEKIVTDEEIDRLISRIEKV
jgi:uncharacterized coiled-coil DUF342 family protein